MECGARPQGIHHTNPLNKSNPLEDSFGGLTLQPLRGKNQGGATKAPCSPVLGSAMDALFRKCPLAGKLRESGSI